MSFLIALNGQFVPFVPPPAGGGVTPVVRLQNLGEVHEFKEVLDESFQHDHHKDSQRKLEVYKLIEKKYDQQRKRQYAKDIMTCPVKSISSKALAVEAKVLLNRYGFRHLPVVNENQVITGMISDREICGVLENKNCEQIMVQKLIVCEEHASINEIAIILLREKINALPIINLKRELIGIVTLSDILKFVIESTKFLGRG